MDEWLRPSEAMNRIIALITFLLIAAATAYAADNIDEICKKEGGCFLITQRAYETLMGELTKMQEIIVKMKKEQCA